MTIDGFLTFLALIVAIYAVIPKVTRRTIDVKLGLTSRWIAGTALSVILLLQLYEPIHAIFHIASFGLSRSGLHPQNVAFVILVLAALYIALVIRYGAIPTRRLGKLQRLIEAAIEAELFADLVDEVLVPNVAWVAAISRDESATSQDGPIASNILRITFTSPKLVSFIAASKPYAGITILKQQNVYYVHEFTSLYFRNLMSDPHSILYFEIRNNQNISTTSGYEFPEHNRLLHFLFGGAKNAERLGVWQPVGEYLLNGPASPELEENRNFLNRRMRDFHEIGRWTHPFAIGIRFFDLMVSAALVQNVQWHMWLWYFTHFTDILVDNLDISAPEMDTDAEWPTVGYYLLYEMFSAMTHWIELVEYLPADQANVVMLNTRIDHENQNIPKSAILVMMLCFQKVLISENIIPLSRDTSATFY